MKTLIIMVIYVPLIILTVKLTQNYEFNKQIKIVILIIIYNFNNKIK